MYFLLFLFLLIVFIIIFRNLLKYKFIELCLIFSNKIVSKNSLIGNSHIYSNNIVMEGPILEKNWEIFRKEALESYSKCETICNDPYFQDLVSNKKDWKKLYIKWYSDIDPLAKKLCPKTCEIISKMPNIKLAMFSILQPRTTIKIHNGPSKSCLRYHLGLSTPNSKDCYISINWEKYYWKDGEGVFFDDTYPHYVENNTDKIRIILFCDIVRPVKDGFPKIVNDFVNEKLGPLTTRKN